MKILLDAGNTRIKWAALEEGRLAETGELKGDEPFSGLAQSHAAPEAVWLASVRDDAFNESLRESAANAWPGVPFHAAQTGGEAHGVTCAYPEPHQMGVDRWLALLAARDMTPDPVCVVDAGSAVTLDAMDELGRHLGGLILPGMAMARQMIHERTARVRVAESFQPSWWADNTSDALNNGMHWAIVSLVARFRQETEQRLAVHCPLILTGGDAPAIMAYLDGREQHEPDLVLKGLALVAEGDE